MGHEAAHRPGGRPRQNQIRVEQLFFTNTMNTSLPRREFLKQTAVVVTAASLAPALAGAESPGKKRPIKKAMMYGTIGYKGTVLEKFKALKEAGFDGEEPNSHMNQEEVLKAFEVTGLKAASVC